MLKVVPIGRELLDMPFLPGDPIIERAQGILRRAPPSFIAELLPKEAPLIVFDEATGRKIADMMEDRVIGERSSESGRMDLMRGFSTHSDLLVYLMDASLNTTLDDELERIHRWLLSRYGMLSGPSEELGVRLVGRLNYLRRRVLSYQLTYLVREGVLR